MAKHLPNSGETPVEPSGTLSPIDVPFAGLVEEPNFNQDLKIESRVINASTRETRKILTAVDNKKNFLPGQPRIPLDDDAKDGKNPLLAYLQESHSTKKLDGLLPYMRFIFVQTPSYEHIMPLHHQAAHARQIKVTEEPGLHLVWYHELMYLKPIPAYFYSPAFWEYLKNAHKEDETLYNTCVGFMRSYYMLIKYEIDFKEACKLGLIPKRGKVNGTGKGKGQGRLPTYEEWCKFIVPFARVGDNYVNARYRFGELRLTRINRTAMIFGRSLAYYHIYPQWGSFLKHTLAPIITLFAVCSVVLNSMQVGLAAVAMAQAAPPPPGLWPRFVDASTWFPVAVISCLAALLVGTVLGLAVMGLRDFIRGNDVRRRKGRGEPDVGVRTHGMIW